MYQEGQLRVPEELVVRVLLDFHSSSGHCGVARMAKEVQHRFVLPLQVPLIVTLQGIKRACKICQAEDPPH